ncbi:MAG TPA: branched-chain amino acid ABC transporter permease [Ilumatobacteraceae bacterium]
MAARFRLVQGTPQYRAYRWTFWALWVLVIVLVAFAFSDVGQISIGENSYNVSLIRLNKAIAYMIAILGLQVVVGFTGQLALGQSFFFGTGAYLAAWLVADHGWPFLATLAVIVPACFVLGMIIGIPALRIKGLYLALVTLGLAAVFPAIVQLDKLEPYTGGAGGKIVRAEFVPPSWFPINGIANFLQGIPLIGQYFGDGDLPDREAEAVWKYFLFAVVAAVCFWMVNNLVKSRPGRAIRAIRDNETSAAVSGINLALNKTWSFGFASALGGVGGMIYVAELGIASPGDFTQLLAINFIVGLVVGGVGTLSGAVVGGFVIAFVPDWAASTTDVPVVPERWLQGNTGGLILGIMLILLTFFMPGGIVAGFRKLKARVVQVVPSAPRVAVDPIAPPPEPDPFNPLPDDVVGDGVGDSPLDTTEAHPAV